MKLSPEDLAGITRELSSVYGESDRRGYLVHSNIRSVLKCSAPIFVKG